MYGAPLVVLRVTFDLITFYFKFFIIAFRTCPGTVACERVCLNRIACAHPNAFPGHSVVPQYPFYSPAGMELHSNGCPDNVPNPLSPREVIRHGRRRCGLARHPRGRLEVDQADSGELRERSVGVFVPIMSPTHPVPARSSATAGGDAVWLDTRAGVWRLTRRILASCANVPLGYLSR